MDEDVIEDIADEFAKQLEDCKRFKMAVYYREAVLDDIIILANVIARWKPTYDLRYFYRRAGYPEPYPVHPMGM
jgi:hypothetical protein